MYAACCADAALLVAFNLVELDGQDLRREPIETRKAALLQRCLGLVLNIVFNHPGDGRFWRQLVHKLRPNILD